MSFKRLFARSLEAAPGRLHFAAHSHHLWPDASWDGHAQAWHDAARLADHKWDRLFAEVIPEAQRHIARELALPDPATIAFAPNTHELLVRLVSALPMAKPRILSTTGEFHSFRRQAAKWMLDGKIEWACVDPASLVTYAQSGDYDLIFASHVQFNFGLALPDLAGLAAVSRPEGPWVMIDGYHGFMAMPTDLSALADRIFYLAGGYKYAMAGEGVAFLHAPPGFAPQPANTGWFAEFDELEGSAGTIGYAPDGRRFLGSTFDPSGLYRFNAVQRMLAAEGLTTPLISKHCSELKAHFVAVGHLPGYTLINGPQRHFCADMDDAESRTAALLGRNPESQQRARFLAYMSDEEGGAEVLHRALAERDVVTDVRNDVLRIGFAIYQDELDVHRLAAVLREVQSG